MALRIWIFSFWIGFLLLTACGQNKNDDLPAPDSRSVESTQAFPGVVRVISKGKVCTGVFVSSRAVLTASHCVHSRTRVSVQTSFGTFDSENVVQNGPGIEGDSRDLAVVIFPENVVPSTATYAIGSVSLGESVHLVGYGCSNISNHGNSGIKRTGTNVIYRIERYLEVLTPIRVPTSPRGILGPLNRAGSCFGDSGGPMLKNQGSGYVIVGINHAVIPDGNQQISAYIHLGKEENLTFLKKINSRYQLGIRGF